MNLSAESGQDCPDVTDWDQKIISFFQFWISGVVLCAVGFTGLILNFIAIIVLSSSRKTNRIFFNKLLISLFIFDFIYITMEVLDTLGFRFKLITKAHILLYPQLLRPLTKISLTASIFMTVAIAYERFAAVRRPIKHRQYLSSKGFQRRSLIKYLVCVILWAIVLNIPIWFESEIIWKATNISTIEHNVTNRYGIWILYDIKLDNVFLVLISQNLRSKLLL